MITNRTIALPMPVEKTTVSVFTIWLVTLSGMVGIYLGGEDWFLPKTPLNLLLGAGLLLWNFPARNGLRSFAVWTAAFLIGMGVEALGVNYGWLFGDYFYGENLGPKAFGVPLIIGINWVVLTFLTAYLGKRVFDNRWLAALTGAVLMVALDVFIEPVAPVFDFWHWEAGYAPLQNFIAWFFVALVLQILVRNEVPDRKHPLPLHHFAAQAVFFAFFYACNHL